MAETTLAAVIRLNGGKVKGVSPNEVRRLLTAMGTVRLGLLAPMTNGELAEFIESRCTGPNRVSNPLHAATRLLVVIRQFVGGNLNVRGATGVQFGDGNVQNNQF